MAGDWIPMRLDIARDPAVIGMAAALGLDEDTVVGKLHRLWSWANEQLQDGNAVGVTETWLDRHVGVTGFAQAMSAQGWLLVDNEGIAIPHFDTYNSKSAKTRLLTARRVARYRNADSVTNALPREEKRREEGKTPPNPPKGGSAEPQNDADSTPAVKKRKKKQIIKIPENLKTSEFKAAWADWLEHLKQKHKPPTTLAKQRQLAKCSKMGATEAVAMINHSIAGNWQGLYAEGKSYGQGSTTANQANPRFGGEQDKLKFPRGDKLTAG